MAVKNSIYRGYYLRAACRKSLEDDPFMEECCLCSSPVDYFYRNNFYFKDKKTMEKFSILPLCTNHYLNLWMLQIKMAVNKIMFARMTENDIIRYPHLTMILVRVISNE